MRIAHVSDTHDHPELVRDACARSVDVVLITGDCIRNYGRVDGRINGNSERSYQESWFRQEAWYWAEALGGKPLIVVPGNHDFISYSPWLSHYGAEVYEISDGVPCVEVCGKVWAGFRQVLPLTGEWVGETSDLRPHVDCAMGCNPDILVTHAPPAGILDGDGYGDASLSAALFYREHRVTHHFFGHTHRHGGECVEEGGIKFINGACHVREYEL